MDAFLTDSHTHLDSASFDDDLEQVIENAHAQGVGRIITVGSLDGLVGAQKSLQIARSHENIWAAVAIHPHDAKLAYPETLARFETLASDPLVVAIGETGLDYHYDHSPRAQQREVFRAFIRMAHAHDKPLVIHTREAIEDTLIIMDELDGWSAGGVFHCYSGDEKLASLILDRGFYLSFAGVVTFRKAIDTRNLIRDLPRDRVLIETDAPYLTPVPFRGKRNEPARVRYTAEAIAALWETTIDEVARITSDNAASLFGLDDIPRTTP
jgi:TatD DNase family protein